MTIFKSSAFARFITILALLCMAACDPGGSEPPPEGTCPDDWILFGSVCLPPDGDADGDGIDNATDNCPEDANPDQEDLDGDTQGDACDSDDDSDGIADADDNCAEVPNAGQLDTDGDLQGDACDLDDDQDGIDDSDDVCPLHWDPNQADTDNDGDGNLCDDDDDNDGILDDFDNCPVFANPGQEDSDHDGIGDLCLQDADGDGVPDLNDNCPDNPNVDQSDTDSDTAGNACDDDDDNDGILDPFDNCPLAANPGQEDDNGDSIGDVCEGDLDGDGVDDELDNCPLNANPGQGDYDADGIGDVCDEDANGDGIPDLINSVEPSGGVVGGGLAVILEGSGFETGATVTFGGVAASHAVVVAANRIMTTTPPGAVGAVTVVATNPDGQTFTAYNGFEYVASTQVRGRVLDTNLVPVPNVIVDLLPADGLPVQAATDATGFFILENASAGSRTVEFNPANAGVAGGPSYPALKVPIEVIDGRINILGEGRPTFLPILDTTHVEIVDPANETVVNSSAPSAAPGSDGAVLTIDAGNAVDENGATYTGEVLISEVAAERTPIALGDRRQPAYLITVQPAGVEFDTPAPVSFPNVDGHPAFARMPLLGLNHDTGEFEATGLLEVSADGERLVTVTGGVSTSSWYLPNPNPPSGEPCCSGDGAPPDADGDGIPDSKDPDFPGNDQNNEDLAPGDCAETAGSSVALSDGDLRIYHSLVTYVSKGINRGLHFTYTLHGAAPRPQVRARFTLPGNDPNQPGALGANASQISHSLKLDGVPIGERIFTSTDLGQEDTSYFRDLSFDASDVPTGVYGLTIATTSEFSSSSFASEFPRNLMIWNARLSAIGVGWGVGETARIYQGSITGYVLLARGDGSMAAFLAPSSGVGVAISPRGEFSSLEFLADGSFEFRADDGSIESYNAEGLLVTITGPLGDFSTLAYDTSFRLTELIDPAGLSTTLSYAGALLDTTTDPGGRVTRFVHDPQGHLVQIIDPDGASRGFSYNSLGQLTSQVSPSGETTTYNIADNGSVQSIELPDGTVRVLSPALLQGLQLPEQGEGIELAPGPLQIVGETAGSFIDGQGNVFTTEINSLGQPTSRTGPDGATVRFEYDGTGNLQEMSDPADAIITFEYDEDRERLVSRTVLDSATGEIIVTGIQYDETTDLPSAILHPDGGQSIFTWDADSLLTGLSDPLGRATTLTYDTDGAVASATTPSGALTTWQRDSQGLLVSATGPDGNTTSYTRDSLGRMTERIDADGGSTQFSWDDGNSLTSVTDPAGGVSNFTYDAARRRTSYSDPEGRLTEFTYDGRNRHTSRTTPAGTDTYEYDGNNNLTVHVRRNGDRNEYTYDAYDRLVRKELADGSVTDFSYDLAGRLIYASNAEATLVYEYDAFDRVTSEQMFGFPQLQLQFEYDNMGRRTRLTSTEGARDINYTWDISGQLLSVDEGSESVDLQYDLDARPAGVQYSNGLEASYIWSPGGRLESLQYTLGAQDVLGWDYVYNSAGQRSAATAANGDTYSYSYDALGALSQVTGPGSTTDESYSYDGAGNRLSSLAAGSHSYDSDHRLTEDDDFLYTWDANGTLQTRTDKTTNDVTIYQWNSESLLLGITIEDSTTHLLSSVSYRYDPVGRRIGRVVDFPEYEEFFYVYDGPNLLAETTSDGLPIASYVYSQLDTPVWRVDSNGDVQYFLRDAARNIVGIADSTGGLVQSTQYDAFGNILSQSNPSFDQPLGFHARPLDPESGLYYFRRRYYDPSNGRFLSEDPKRGVLTNPQSLNLYTAFLGDPFVYSDPFGSAAVTNSSITIGFGIGAGFYLGANLTLSVDSLGNVSLKGCGEAGVGAGGGYSAAASVGEGAISTDTSYSGSLQAEVSASIPGCDVGVNAQVSTSKNFSVPCIESDTIGTGVGARIGCGDNGYSATATSTNGESWQGRSRFSHAAGSGSGVGSGAGASPGNSGRADVSAGVRAKATAKACGSVGGTYRRASRGSGGRNGRNR